MDHRPVMPQVDLDHNQIVMYDLLCAASMHIISVSLPCEPSRDTSVRTRALPFSSFDLI